MSDVPVFGSRGDTSPRIGDINALRDETTSHVLAATTIKIVPEMAGKHEDAPNEQVSMSNLPNDVVLYIFSMCDARTIGKLRQCCTDFWAVSHNQIVWLEVLKETCADLCLPMLSFQQDEHSSSDIELLATAWIRFQRVLRNTPDGITPPYKLVRSIEIADSSNVLNLDQSPDGRFLFLAHNGGIRVWSLQTRSPTLVSTFDMDISQDCWASLAVCIETDHSYLVYMFILGRLQPLNQWVAFRFNFSSSGYGENYLELLSQLDRLTFSAQKWYGWAAIPSMPLLITSFEHTSEGRFYVLWDAASGTCAKWLADKNDISNDLSIFIVSDFIIAFDNPSQAMVVYAQPGIPPKCSYVPDVCATLKNPALLHIPAEPERLNRSGVSMTYWNTYPSHGHLVTNHDGLSSIHNIDDENWLLEHIEICRADSTSATFSPLPLNCERWHSYHTRSLPFKEGLSRISDVCIDESVLIHSNSSDWTQVVFHLSSPNGNNGNTELGRGILYDSKSDGGFLFGKNRYSVCSLAGRMCIGTLHSIEIMDFVEMPYLQDNVTVHGNDREVHSDSR
ncbi:hypothetical protein DL96DRAFT_1609389 [Flagelloscypha sp. PMI_526]|nr:hypothetical protein DL96DRAFT_1609389 [Flagelloscypha sp. PMI_526]